MGWPGSVLDEWLSFTNRDRHLPPTPELAPLTYQRLQLLQASLMPGDLSDHVDRVRYERTHPTRPPSRKQLAKMREMLSDMELNELLEATRLVETSNVE